ncbi:hypothetical protein C8Q74DRAFT_1229680 [Fomes fomentarius]|nr:hypothetical protein C8Q74DRAFT_1229680 [Fomes fomentarius]
MVILKLCRHVSQFRGEGVSTQVSGQHIPIGPASPHTVLHYKAHVQYNTRVVLVGGCGPVEEARVTDGPWLLPHPSDVSRPPWNSRYHTKRSRIPVSRYHAPPHRSRARSPRAQSVSALDVWYQVIVRLRQAHPARLTAWSCASSLAYHSKRMDGASLVRNSPHITPETAETAVGRATRTSRAGPVSSSIQRTYEPLLPAPFIFSDVGLGTGCGSHAFHREPSTRQYSLHGSHAPVSMCTLPTGRLAADTGEDTISARRPPRRYLITYIHSTIGPPPASSHIVPLLPPYHTIFRVKLPRRTPSYYLRVSAGCVRLPTMYITI